MATLEELEAAEARLQASREPSIADLEAVEQRLRATPLPSTGTVSGDFMRGVDKALTRNMVEPGIGDRYIGDPVQEFFGLDPKGRRESIKRKQAEKGVDVDRRSSSFSEEVGELTPGAVEMGAGMVVAGPGIAALGTAAKGYRGLKTIGKLLEFAGKSARAQPVATIAGSVTGTPGGLYGGDVGELVGKYGGGALGSFVDAVAGTNVADSFEEGGKKVGRVGGAVVGSAVTGAPGSMIGARVPYIRTPGAPFLKNERGALLDESLGGRPSQPLLRKELEYPGGITETVDTTTVPQFARNQVDHMRVRLDAGIDRIIRNLTPALTSKRNVSEEFVGQLRALEREQTAIANAMWERIPMNEQVDPSPLIDAVLRLTPTLQTNAGAVPGHTMDAIMRIGATARQTITGQTVYQARPLTVRQMMSLRSSIGQDIREAMSGSRAGGPNPQLARSLHQLEDALDDSVSTSLPNDVTVQQAREATRVLSDRFRRSEIATVLGMHESGATRVHADQAVRHLLEKHNAAREVYTATHQLTPDTPAPASMVPDPQNPGQMRLGPAGSTREQFHQGAIAEYQDIARQEAARVAPLDPKNSKYHEAIATGKFGQQIESQIVNFARARRTIQDTTDELFRHARDIDDLEKSTLNAFAQKADPEQAVQQLLMANNPAKATSDLVHQIRTARAAGGVTPLAAEAGLKTMLVESLRKQGYGSAQKLYSTFTSQRYQMVMKEVFTDAEMSRMDRMLNTLVSMERGDRGVAERVANKMLATLAGWMGVTAGGATAGALAFGTAARYGALAYPAAFKRALQGQVKQMFEREGAGSILDKALYDPRFESIINRQIPGNWAEAAKHNAVGQRTIRGLEALMNQYNGTGEPTKPSPYIGLEYDAKGQRREPTGTRLQREGAEELRAGLGPETYDQAEQQAVVEASRGAARYDDAYNRAQQSPSLQ